MQVRVEVLVVWCVVWCQSLGSWSGSWSTVQHEDAASFPSKILVLSYMLTGCCCDVLSPLSSSCNHPWPHNQQMLYLRTLATWLTSG